MVCIIFLTTDGSKLGAALGTLLKMLLGCKLGCADGCLEGENDGSLDMLGCGEGISEWDRDGSNDFFEFFLDFLVDVFLLFISPIETAWHNNRRRHAANTVNTQREHVFSYYVLCTKRIDSREHFWSAFSSKLVCSWELLFQDGLDKIINFLF